MSFRRKIRKYRRVIYLFAFILFVTAGFWARSSYRNTVVSAIKVSTQDSALLRFADRDSVISFLMRNYQQQIVGAKFKDINLIELANILRKNPYIDSVSVFRADDVINIYIIQRKPLLHVYGKSGTDYYIDKKGFAFPASDKFTGYAIIASGNVPDIRLKDSVFYAVDTAFPVLGRLYTVAKAVYGNKFMSDLTTQIVVDKDTEFVIIPRVGKFKILLGDTTELEKKFLNLEAFYKKALPAVGWDKYSLVNLKYTNQVICKKIK